MERPANSTVKTKALAFIKNNADKPPEWLRKEVLARFKLNLKMSAVVRIKQRITKRSQTEITRSSETAIRKIDDVETHMHAIMIDSSAKEHARIQAGRTVLEAVKTREQLLRVEDERGSTDFEIVISEESANELKDDS